MVWDPAHKVRLNSQTILKTYLDNRSSIFRVVGILWCLRIFDKAKNGLFDSHHILLLEIVEQILEFNINNRNLICK